jgi:Tol biopolymer transport system component
VDRRTFVGALAAVSGAAAIRKRGGGPGVEASEWLDAAPAVQRSSVRFLVTDPDYVYARPCLSPAGDRVVFARAPATEDPVKAMNADSSPWILCSVGLDGGREIPLFNSSDLSSTRPDWSWTSNRIAFTGIADGRADLWILDGEGGDPVRVELGSPARTRIFYPSWYPDGERVAVTDYETRQVLQVDVDGRSALPLTDPARTWAGMSTVSPDTAAGNPLAFAGQPPNSRGWDPESNSIWLQSSGGARRQLDGKGGRMPAWSPDGKRLAYVSARRRPAPTFSMHRRSVPGGLYSVFLQSVGPTLLPEGSPRAVTPFDQVALHPKWSPDGKRIACMLKSLATGQRGIALIELDDGA